MLSHEPVTSYAKYLKFRYQKPLPDDDRILKSTGKIYIELAVIRNENISREEADEFTKKSLHGLTEEILQKKTPVALEDILKPGDDGRPVRRVLVEGAPGVGKSVFAWQLCHKWAHKLENLKHFDLVVLVQLRGKRAQEAKYLSDLFPLSKNNSIEQVIDEIGNGQNILIILDGFDELPREQRQEGSVYIDLIKDQELLPEATVIITSRPSVSAYIMKYPIDRRLEILGFTEAKIIEYAKSVNFSDPTCQTKFLEYINGNPVIKGMMYLPLNAFFVASIFEFNYRTNSPYPKTITQLYDALIRSLIRRHLAVPDDYSMPKSLMCREDIDSLPHAVATQLLVIARIAYEGLCDEKYVFTDLDGSKFDHLGMMKKTTSLDDTAVGPTYTFSFLHLNLQDYLSMLYLSVGQTLSNKDNRPRNRPKNSREIIKIQVSCDYNFLIFLVGLCKHSTNFPCRDVGDLYVSMIPQCQHEHDYPCIPAQIVRCVYESDSIVQESWKLLNLFAINGNKTVTAELLSPFDSYLIGHYISCHGGVWFIKTNQLDLFVEGLKSCNGSQKGKLKILSIRDTELLTLDPVLLVSLESISFDKVTFSASSVAIIQQYILSNYSLKNLTAWDCKHVELLLPIVLKLSSLEVITVYSPGLFIDHYTILQLLFNNLNLIKEMQLTFAVKLPGSTMCDNTSLIHLANHIRFFLDLAKWNLIMQKCLVKLTYIRQDHVTMQVIKKTHNNVLTVVVHKGFYQQCAYNTTQKLLLLIPEQYHKFIIHTDICNCVKRTD